MSQSLNKRIERLENQLKALKEKQKLEDGSKVNYGVVTETDSFFVRTLYAGKTGSSDLVCVLPKRYWGKRSVNILPDGRKSWNGPGKSVCAFCKSDIQEIIQELQELLDRAPEKPIYADSVFRGEFLNQIMTFYIEKKR